ncbi:5-(carboxyamino)imidazole ribonucleotide synthase [Prochlorococcus sp. MIT 1341]|uniref:5-(carboxyamino)imidazole ribonucleotide synthase n=1 Tax=Prochlorococcus sp. MIT 1341 TaxID=3096221 RepID=UPI002A763A84|nr:5-(carboxyamino)imidazole ribonucleotide synthase [Prochlorococcus sp. MIT 1341]
MSSLSISTPSIHKTLIGVIGGGQLAQMLVEAAIIRDVNVVVQTGSIEDPATAKATKLVLANPIDAVATRDLVKHCKGVTFENEWINVRKLRSLEQEGATFYPALTAIEPLIDKISQRLLLQKLNIPGPKWTSLASIIDHPIELPPGWTYPVMAKATKGGYDGKGTRVIEDSNDLETLLRSVNQNHWFLESWVPYENELALVCSRDRAGTIRTFPLVETHQTNQVCDWVLAPAEVNHSVEVLAYNIACSLLTELDYVGVLGIEFFYGSKGLLVNEIAPRTHNSGHFSIEACNSSQFDQQLCISADLVPPNPELVHPGALMVNLLGLPKGNFKPLKQRLLELEALDNSFLHWYGKEKEIFARKLGHVTVLLQGKDSMSRRREAESAIQAIRSIWPPLNMNSL